MAAAADTIDAVIIPVQHSIVETDCMLNVSKMDGRIFQCTLAADSRVQDLLDVVAGADEAFESVDKVNAALLDINLLTENGVVMEKCLKLSDYGLSSNGMVTMAKAKHINGCYTCWVTVDTSIQLIYGQEKFILEINDKSVSVDGVEGKADGDIGDDEVSVTFPAPITIRSSVPHSTAFFRATGCKLRCKAVNFSSSWSYHLEGTLLGTSHSNGRMKSSGIFKGRFCGASHM